ncbi:uncharacterized protein LOC118199119 isoform X2 [Stegodyphus dumicola]|uniref:uncharacterized protein LOC118199119 isoform X2 n=1 Tax=Stegodyphus dumicola TaxID=202533 RepID=UPI0015AE3331|nr:uncharacterized protein LOC118199119 isoform X2 [Stegodyphus dumicola]
MNSRVFALNRPPVVAWNVEPQLQLPYADMPAAAAISPIVPGASDPYGRCWQNQVDAGTSFPYFGTLYNNSLPPAAYHLQPGCMANLGQFWPPTPPPDGCGRFDGSNLYFGPPVLRHTENVSSNLHSSFQNLGHYSHLLETPKESSQLVFKRETPISPNVSTSNVSVCSPVVKSENLNSYCVDSKLKSQVCVPSNLSKREFRSAQSPGQDPYFCVTDYRNCSSAHPSTDKARFSPSCSLKNNFHGSSQDNLYKSKAINGTQENTCNASPLKNVYFSHFESENVNTPQCKKFSKISDGQSHLGFRKNLQEVTKTKHSPHSLDSFLLHTNHLSKKYNFDTSASPESRRPKDSICKVKSEKSSPSDCKFQKLESKDSVIYKVPECRNSVFNIPTSVAHLKVEPSDKYFLPSCSSTPQSCVATSYAKSGPLVLINREIPPELRTGATYHNRVYSNPCSLSKSWQYNDTAIASPDKYSKPQEAAKPPTRDMPQANSTLLEGLISVAQTAPQDIDVLGMDRKLQRSEFPCTSLKPSETSEPDDDVQIISIQTKTPLSPKCSVNHTSVIKTSCSSSSDIKPLISKDAKEEQINIQSLHPTSSCQNSKVEDQEIQDLSMKSSVRSDQKVNEKQVLCDNSDSDCEITGLVINERNKISVKQNSYKQVTIKSERTSDNLSDCEDVTRKELVQEKDTLSNVKHCPVLESKQEIKTDNNIGCIRASSLTSCVKNVAFDPSSVCVPDIDENHGLTLLLNTIEKITSFEKRDISVHSDKSHLTEIDYQPGIYTRPEFSKTYGLDLLSTIAGERLIAEFKTVDSESSISYENASNCSNEKEDAKLVSNEEQLKCVENSVNSQKTSVLEMQGRLVELQEKYKQKQKELSRLKSKRLSGGYLKRRHKCTKRLSETSTVSNSTASSTDLSSIVSCPNSDQGFLTSENEMSFEIKSEKVENDDTEAKKSVKKNAPEVLKNELLPKSDLNLTEKRITRRSCKKYNIKCITIKSSDEDLATPEKPKRVKKKNVVNMEESQNSKDRLNEEVSKATNNHSDNKNTKVYSLRHLSQNLSKKCKRSLLLDDSVSVSKTVPSKRKSDNPKKFMPSKQSKLSETIIAKHLRSRILFDTSGSLSDDNDLKDGVPEELYDAFMKCNLDERKNVGMIKKTCVASQDPLGSPAPSRLKAEHLIEKQRLLALEDGLFYAGCIKELQLSDKYGIALDGQRGNKLHSFSREELLSQAITESKPLTSDLPEGTRVCAYWSQQYRCLYPGVVGKAPSPSADWSEPRVFVLFDDGDSGQIPIKNIRLIPTDILPHEPGQKVDSQMTSSKNADNSLKRCTRRQTSRTRSFDMKMKKCDTSNENESKESSCTSVNESSCDDSCFVECHLSPSQTCENHDSIETSDAVINSINASKSEKKQRKRSKCKTIRRIRPKETESVDSTGKCNAKIKHHKKYKDKHRRHHHHHHHHRHHHHHHHHSKKRKHRRRNVKNIVTRGIANENIFPCSTKSKSFKNQIELEVCTSHVEHSSVINLPQIEQMK